MKPNPPTRRRALRLIALLLASSFLIGAAGHDKGDPAWPGHRNLRPVIGVFSQDTDTVTTSSTIDPEVKAELSSYRYMIPASYVSWIGQAGGRRSQ